MNLKKLKETARKHEQKEQWHKAIKVYLRAIEASDAGVEAVPDLSLYNRVGDLYMKVNDTAAAVKTYERAVDLYADQGFANNAIALCGKVLRVNPGRVQTYLTLAKLYARKNFVVDAKKNLLEYLERMNKAQRRDEAFREVSNFADQFRGEVEIRDMLRELVQAAARGADSAEGLEKLAADLGGDVQDQSDGAPGAGRGPGGLVFLDTGEEALPAASHLEPVPVPVPEASPPPPPPPPPPSLEPEEVPTASDLTFLDVDEAPEALPELTDLEPGDAETAIDEEPLPELEPTALESTPGEEPVDELEGLEVDGGMTAEDRAAAVEDDTDLEVEATALESIDVEAVPDRLDDLVPTEYADADAAALDEEVTPVETVGTNEVPDLDVADDLDIDTTTVEPVVEWDEAPETEETALADSDEVEVVAESDLEPIVEWDETSETEEAVLVRPDEIDITDVPEAPEEVDDEEAPVEAVVLESDTVPTEAQASAVHDDDLVRVGDAVDHEAEPTEWVPPPPSMPTKQDVIALEERLLENPNDPYAHRALGEGLIATGSKARGVEELELALAGFEEHNDWGHCGDVLRELTRLDPNRIKYYQKRVELSYRSGDKYRLVDAYLELGDVLVRVGSLDKALAVYGRVLEHDPANEFAQAAFDALRPVPASRDPSREAVQPAAAAPPAAATAEADEDYVDLGALVLEPRRERDTRIRVDDEEPTGDEDRDFEIMLQQFKSALDDSLTEEDYQAHYDLGVAFKEMGLLDEAIAEFQKALRAPEGRLRTSEALGVSFYEKGQFPIAEAILRRAVEGVDGLDDEKIGLLYWLGRSSESQGREREAISAYERALAVDVGFMDVNERVKRLTSGHG